MNEWVIAGRVEFAERIRRQSLGWLARSEVAAMDLASIPAPAGPIAARLYEYTGPVTQRFLFDDVVILFFHSGGFVMGDLETGDPVARALCMSSGSPVISVAYRLAPEWPFPAAVEDCLAAMSWLISNLTHILPGRTRVVVAGDSAGGNLAAMVAATSPESIAAQCLFYPCIDLRGSHLRPGPQLDLFSDPDILRAVYSLYLPGRSEEEVRSASPGLSEAAVGRTPTVVVAGAFDPLRLEAFEYSETLTASGVAAVFLCFPLMHGFVEHYLSDEVARTATDIAISSVAMLLR